MAQAFLRNGEDPSRIVGFMEDVERSLVIELMYQTSVLLSDGSYAEHDAKPETSRTPEDDLFASLGASMREREAPEDPALRRLLPDGVKDDERAASEFRRFTEANLRERKLTNLETAMRAFERGFVDEEQAAAIADDAYDSASDGGSVEAADRARARGEAVDGLADGSREVSLTEAEARAAMMALTDVRLVLAERLGIRTDTDSEGLTRRLESSGGRSSPEDLMVAYYDFLTWLSESLTLAVMDGPRRGAR